MELKTILNHALNSKDTSNSRLDGIIDFIPKCCSNEAISIIQAGIKSFRNCSINMTDWLCVDGDERKELLNGNLGERVFFSSDLRRSTEDNHQAPHNRIFMSITFLDKSLEFESYRRLDVDPQETMYEHARRYQSEKSEFLYAVAGVINNIQQHEYTFFDTHEEGSGELILIFFNSKSQYQLISVMLNFKALYDDSDLLKIFGADESEVHKTDDDDDDFSISYIH